MNNTIQRKLAAFAFVVLAGLALSISSCKKDDNNNSGGDTNAVSEEEVAQLTADAVSPENGGFVAQTENSVMLCALTPMVCGMVKDSTVGGASAAGAARSFSYMFDWHYALSCDGSVPKKMSFSFNGHSSFDGPRMASSDSCSGGLEVVNLLSSFTAYRVNATYMRTGSQTSRIGDKTNFTSTLKLTASEVIIDKLTRQIKSGTAHVEVSGKSSTGKSFTFGGNLTFLGAKTGELVLNSGVKYSVNW
jgi:hypothetical protein